MPSYFQSASRSLAPRPSTLGLSLPNGLALSFILFLFLALGSTLFAQSPTLRVNNVRFSLERSPYGGNPWLEMEVVLDVRGISNATAPNPEFLDDLRVEVALAQNLGNPSRPRLEYFWTHIEIPTLERGTRTLRFYLSPEQVERGRIINDDPYAWYVQVAFGEPGGGTGQPLQPVIAVSTNLREQPRLDRFLQLLDEQKEKRSGILLPQAETPFRDAYADDTPTIKGQNRFE